MKSQRNPRGKSFAMPDSPCVPFIGQDTQNLIRLDTIGNYPPHNQSINRTASSGLTGH
jgi:hypothetical protein